MLEFRVKLPALNETKHPYLGYLVFVLITIVADRPQLFSFDDGAVQKCTYTHQAMFLLPGGQSELTSNEGGAE